MSLNFGGYSVTIKSKGKKLAVGHSSPGPDCSYHAALTDAINTPEFREFINTSDSLYNDVDLTISRLVITLMS